MKKILTIACAAAALAVPAAALGSDDASTSAAHFCKQLQTASGGKHSAGFAQAVRVLVGGSKVTAKNAYGKCVSFKARENRTETEQAQEQAHSNAAKECKAQRSGDPAAFATKWGGKKNAYGKCVSATARSNEQEQADQQKAEDHNDINAARQCRAQRKADADAFATKWGSRKNAYGKCVSATARELNQDES